MADPGIRTSAPCRGGDDGSESGATERGFQREMSEFDALLWRGERHPLVSATVVMLEVLDTVPDWNRLRTDHEWMTRRVPRFRQRVVEPALGLTPPVWSLDPDFDLDYHLRRVEPAGAKDMEELLKIAESLALAPFDRTRPLWEARVVEGLVGGRAAYLFKLHHAVTDGLGAMQLLGLIRSRTRAASPRDSGIEVESGIEMESGRTDSIGVAVEQLIQHADLPVEGAGLLLRSVWSLFNRPVATARETIGFAESVRRSVAPPAPPSPIFANRNGKMWRYGVLECSLAELKAAGRSAGGSVNDAFLAAILGGVGHYHERFGRAISEIGTMMPVSLRRPDDPAAGNRLGTALFASPVGICDPAERIAAVHAVTKAARGEPALDALGVVAPVLNRLPWGLGASVLKSMGANADIGVSNVPGQREEVYLAGARVDRMFAFGPLPGTAMYAALNSHVGTCCIGINYDGSVIEQPDLFMSDLQDGLDEVLALSLRDAPPPHNVEQSDDVSSSNLRAK